MVAGWCNKYDYNSSFNKPYGVKNQSRTKGSKMSDMKCPFCQQKLESFSVENRPVFACCNLNYKGYFMNAPKELWQELIRTRKALEIAVDAINTGKTLADIAGFKMLVAGLEKAIEQITTQVQTNK